ncbi:helix-turn-helix transcriptional regulator [Parasphingorhabdus halotolerans]|uniref:Helix-turn-helix transcriptional regulator n=1 Tax=Parasphingorhabdus halotolerans TaxID=2725558 RepID=A0A6H2DND4_9SPHN|nr:helix-turn-helix transcriptional regulator [Parasphingorhabdus halotolerans]QJB69864.1 helix-turn-helix transcriptional regulator [Parasphingorhabdus halotolerans]
MLKQFSHDLRLARRKAGLTQNDLAHLMATTDKEISALEHGRKIPSLPQICELSLIYGRSFESLFADLMEYGKKKLRHQMPSLSNDVRNHVGTINRSATLERVTRRMNDTRSPYERT